MPQRAVMTTSEDKVGTLVTIFIIGYTILLIGAALEWVGRRRGWPE